MNSNSTSCPKCGSELPDDAPQGLCPRCLAALNFATETIPPEAVPVAPQQPLTPEELAPHFPQLEIIECLGRGGMGVVYKARQKSLNRPVALKLLAPERADDAKFAERFTREAQALATLSHPHIVTIHDFGQAGGFYFLLMEFIDGVNLRQAMSAGRFTPEQALAIVPPVCEALQYAHEHGIVHRDIKPENLLLDKAGRVKIADFGIAKILGSDAGAHSHDEGTVRAEAPASLPFGTPAYAAPEQQNDPQHVDHRADIYSLGVVLYELLTGELPKDKLEPPSKRVQIDVRLDEVVLRALETKPELRFATAAEFRTQLAEVVAQPASPAPVKAAPRPSSRTRRWLGAASVVLGVALLLLASVLNEMVDDFGLTQNARKHLEKRSLNEQAMDVARKAEVETLQALNAAEKAQNTSEIERLARLRDSTQAKVQQVRSAKEQTAILKQKDERERVTIFYLIAGGLIAAGLIACFHRSGSETDKRGAIRGIIGILLVFGLASMFIPWRDDPSSPRDAIPAVPHDVTITGARNWSEPTLSATWTVSTNQPGMVRLDHASGRQSANLQPKDSKYETEVMVTITQTGSDRLRIVMQIGGSRNTQEINGDFKKLRDEVADSALHSAQTTMNTSVVLCQLLGKTVTLELPASDQKRPVAQQATGIAWIHLVLLVLLVVLGGAIWVIRFAFKSGRKGCAVVLLVLLVLFLLLVIAAAAWLFSHRTQVRPPPATPSVSIAKPETPSRTPTAWETRLYDDLLKWRKQEAELGKTHGAEHPQMKAAREQIALLEKLIEQELKRSATGMPSFATNDPRFLATSGVRQLNTRYTLTIDAKAMKGQDGTSSMRSYTLKDSTVDGVNSVVRFAPLAIQNELFLAFFDRDKNELWLASPTLVRWHHLPESGLPSDEVYIKPEVPDAVKHRMPEVFRKAVQHWHFNETDASAAQGGAAGIDHADFLQKPQTGRITITARLTRQHYFEGALPRAAEMDSFKLETEKATVSAFLHRTEPLCERLRSLLPWEESRLFSITLTWRYEDSNRWLELLGAEPL